MEQTTIRMKANQRLEKGETIEITGKGKLILQTDGNLVVYDAANQARWASGTNGKAVTHVVMQGDGNLVVYDRAGQPRFHTHTHGNPGAALHLVGDGRLEVRAVDGRVLWSSP